MRTTTSVHNAAERAQMRRRGDLRARVCQVQLLCVVSVLRTALTDVLPQCGSAAWWVLALCLTPGLALYGMACLALKKTGALTLTEAARMLLGQAGAWMAAAIMSGLILWDGAATMTALITAFTEGIGTQGTQVTMAILTLIAMLFCLNRDGLAWGIYLMRLALMAMALGVGAGMIALAAPDRLHPLMGQGNASILAAVRLSASAGWPLLLLTDVEPPRPGRIRLLAAPVGIPVAVTLLVCLVFPCEALVQETALAAKLLQPAFYLPPALRTLAHNLWLLVMFLAIATAAQLSGKRLCAPLGRDVGWLPGALAALLAATQALNIRRLWRILTLGQMWAPAALAALILLLILWRKPCATSS